MARNSLQVLLSIRRRAVEAARYALAASLTSEAVVADRIAAIDTAMQRDRKASGTWPEAHQFVEMSAARLAAARVEREALAAELASAAARTADARGVVTAARTAAEVVEQLLDERRAASQADAARREQHALDDIVRARLAPRQRA